MRNPIIFILLLGLGLGVLLHAGIVQNSQTKSAAVNCVGEFINPLRCENNNWRIKRDYAPFVADLKSYIDDQRDKGHIQVASVYFRDLDGGPLFFLNEDEKFTAASLLKVPILIAYLKYAETADSTLLDHKLTYVGQLAGGAVQDVDPNKSLVIGEEYTVETLLNKMIVYSDNRSMELLLYHMDEIGTDGNPTINTLKDLGLVEATIKADDFLDVKTYASLFRILYNAAYLTPEMSNKALEILSRVEYNQGLTALIPKNIKVAHKFGERSYEGGVEQLHDCGVVYHPRTHYLLCVMTRGQDKADLSRVIAEISQKIYQASLPRSR